MNIKMLPDFLLQKIMLYNSTPNSYEIKQLFEEWTLINEMFLDYIFPFYNWVLLSTTSKRYLARANRNLSGIHSYKFDDNTGIKSRCAI